MKILPGEFLLLTDNAVIRTKCPQHLVTDEMVAQRCHAINLAAGDFVVVQCFDHSKEVVLAWATYMVVGRVERKKHVQIDDRVSRSFAERNYEVQIVVDWQIPDSLIDQTPSVRIESLQQKEVFVPSEAKRIWNPHRRLHEVRRVDTNELICSHSDQETASRIAAGELPVDA